MNMLPDGFVEWWQNLKRSSFSWLNLIGQDGSLRPVTTVLSGDVSLNNTGNYFSGPTHTLGEQKASLFAIATVTLIDTSSGANFDCKLWDGTNVASSCRVSSTSNSQAITTTLAGYFSAPAGNITLAVKDPTSTSGAIKANSSGNSKDSSITVWRMF